MPLASDLAPSLTRLRNNSGDLVRVNALIADGIHGCGHIEVGLAGQHGRIGVGGGGYDGRI